jgi:hypothetical protein
MPTTRCGYLEQIAMMKQATRVASGLLALAFLIAAIYFGMNESWLVAVLFFLLFGGLEFTAWAFGKSKDGDKHKE